VLPRGIATLGPIKGFSGMIISCLLLIFNITRAGLSGNMK
jgi:hypothetical protein